MVTFCSDKGSISLEGARGSVNEADYVAAVDAARPRFRSGIIPPAIRWISPLGKYVLFERPPTYVDLQYVDIPATRINQHTKWSTYRVPLPWTWYLVLFTGTVVSDVHLFFSPIPLSPLPTEAAVSTCFLAPLTNYRVDGTFCAPMNEIVGTLEWGDVVNQVYQVIWSTGFNHDIVAVLPFWQRTGPTLHTGDDTFHQVYEKWSKLTLTEALTATCVVPTSQLSTFLNLAIQAEREGYNNFGIQQAFTRAFNQLRLRQQ